MNKRLFSLFLLIAALMLAGCGAAPDAGNQGDAQALLTSAQNAFSSGNYEQAAADFQAAATAAASLDAYFGLGNALTRLGRLAEAQAAYEKALEINPNHTPTLSNLGVAYYQLGQLSQAQEMFTKVLQITPQDAETHYLLAATYIQRQNLEAAEQSLQRALEINPTLPEARFGLGILRREQGRVQEAIAEFEAFLAGPPAQDPRARSEAEAILRQLRGQ